MPRYDDRYGSATRLYVGHLSSRTRSRDLERLFCKYGRVRDVDMKRDYAFIDFSDPRDADDARRYYDGREVDGRRIIVEFAKGVPRGPGGSRDYLGRGPPPGSGRCFNCGIEGHWARDCKAGDWKNKCYRCGERGHIEKKCPNSPQKLKRGRSYSRTPERSRSPHRGRRHSRSYSPSRSYSRSRSPARREQVEPERRSRSPAISRSPEPRSATPSKTQKRSPNPTEASPPSQREESPSKRGKVMTDQDGYDRSPPDSNCTVSSILGPQYSELRQRSTVLSGACEEGVASFPVSKESESNGDGGSAVEKVDPMTRVEMMNGDASVGRNLEKEVSLDWKRLMAEDQNHEFHVEKSPMKFLVEEMSAGNSLKNTICLGNEKERERVYDTIFHLPWRCELLINVGFFVCLDSFLSLLTIMPTRIITTFWKILKSRQLNRPSTAELCDFGCFVALIIGVTLLQQTDISLIYHMIRGQGTIKLYVVYNVLEIFDKLFQSFGGDVMQTLFTTAEDLATCSPENMQLWLWRFISDEIIAVTTSIIHSFILLAQAITMSTCIVAHNNALFALLVSNNFTEIKSNVFKRYSKDNVHNLVYSDAVERFHISAFLLFVLAQNILEAEGPWLQSFLYNALVVYICEMMIDIIKHSFIAKFNNIKPMAFSEFLEDLCKQTWNQPENAKNNLVFIPLAPACVVIRVLRPVYAAHLPHNPLPWRLFWILLLSALTFIMLLSLKILVGMGLKKHARWYIKRCQRRKKLHSD